MRPPHCPITADRGPQRRRAALAVVDRPVAPTHRGVGRIDAGDWPRAADARFLPLPAESRLEHTGIGQVRSPRCRGNRSRRLPSGRRRSRRRRTGRADVAPLVHPPAAAIPSARSKGVASGRTGFTVSRRRSAGDSTPILPPSRSPAAQPRPNARAASAEAGEGTEEETYAASPTGLQPRPELADGNRRGIATSPPPSGSPQTRRPSCCWIPAPALTHPEPRSPATAAPAVPATAASAAAPVAPALELPFPLSPPASLPLPPPFASRPRARRSLWWTSSHPHSEGQERRTAPIFTLA